MVARLVRNRELREEHLSLSSHRTGRPAAAACKGTGTVFRLLNEKLGQNVRLRIRRGGEEQELDIAVGFVELANYRMVESQSPTAEQLRIRESWLQRWRHPRGVPVTWLCADLLVISAKERDDRQTIMPMTPERWRRAS
jgi:hypothetical protein